MIKNSDSLSKEAIELISVGKKYPFVKTANKDMNNNFAEFWALKNISLNVSQGEVLGVIGRNGAGKTTFLNIIVGVLSPTQGAVSVSGKILGLFNLGVGFQDELTGRENIFLNGALLGASRKELDDKLDLIVEFSELGEFINMPLGTYSQGMRLRLGFSIIVNLDFDILAIDEVLAVGDTLFQSKCFQSLMDFKRAKKTLVITTQNMDLIERLCDKVALLEHGRLLFSGNAAIGVNKYRALLNTEKFFVGPAQKNTELIENTKKWAHDRSEWGKILGTKEVVIERVEFINRFGRKCAEVKSGTRLKIKVYFRARNIIRDPHFGIAIFKSNGVYCYGPNTAFDGHRIAELKEGSGFFELNYHKLLLAPGEYRISIAIWDKNETLAFNYHQGYYKLIVSGPLNEGGELLNIPFELSPRNYIKFIGNHKCSPDLSDSGSHKIETGKDGIESIKLLNLLNEEKNVFLTNEPVKLVVSFSGFFACNKGAYLWVGIYRDDDVYCQGITAKINQSKKIDVFFPKLPLLPGEYMVSLGIWDKLSRDFRLFRKNAFSFRMVFDKLDHGTVYLEHSWFWR